MRLRNALARKMNAPVSFVRAAYERFHEERCLQLASSLTYTTLLALVPLITVALAIATAFPVFGEWTGQLDGWLAKNVLPRQISGAITNYVGQFSAAAAKLTAVGIVVLAMTAVMLMLTIDRGLNQIFRVSRPRPLVQRLLMYWAVLTLGPVLIGASISMTSYLVSASLGYAKELPLLRFEILRVAPFLLTSAAITLIFLIVPNRRVRLRHALIGGVTAGIAFELMQRGFALYIARFPTYTLVYGAFAAIPIFLVWLYLSWVVVLIGATVAAMLPGYRRAERRGRPAGLQLYEALEVLGCLVEAQRRGRVLPVAEIVGDLQLAPDQIERLIEPMERSGWVARVGGEGWVLAREARSLRMADVYRAFVLDAERARGQLGPRTSALQELVAGQQSVLERRMQMPLSELFGTAPAAADEGGRRERAFELLARGREQK